MAEAVNTVRRHLLLLALFVLPCGAFAHRLDEYLQATLVNIDPEVIRLQINLTPGVQVADQLLPVIDSNHDGVISTNETSAYADLVRHDLTLKLDGRELALKATASEMPAVSELREGVGILQMEFAAMPGSLTDGLHRLAFENRHQTNVSVYLLNAALPKSPAIAITSQKRNDNQRIGEIEFTIRSPEKPDSPTSREVVLPLGVMAVVGLLFLWPRNKSVR